MTTTALGSPTARDDSGAEPEAHTATSAADGIAPHDAAPGFRQHALRGRFNAMFFRVMEPVIRRELGPRKHRVYADLPDLVVEIGAGTGANMRYLPDSAVLIAFEPNLAMHRSLRAAARLHAVPLDLRSDSAERTRLRSRSVDAVISSLVLCTVHDPAAVLAEVRRILRPGGTFRFVEHVAAPEGTATRWAQRAFRRPWAWVFEGCSCERDLEAVIRDAGFSHVELERYRIHSPLIPFTTQIAGIATA